MRRERQIEMLLQREARYASGRSLVGLARRLCKPWWSVVGCGGWVVATVGGWPGGQVQGASVCGWDGLGGLGWGLECREREREEEGRRRGIWVWAAGLGLDWVYGPDRQDGPRLA